MSETPETVIDECKIAPKDVITQDIVETIANGANPKYEVEGYDAKLGTQLGDNFMSIMYSVGIDVTSCDGKEKLEVMVKTMPRNAARVAMINDAQAFTKEIKMYHEILPAMIQFQKERGLSDDEVFSPWAKCYTSRGSESGIGDYIALQDLRPLKYKMACRRQGLNLEDSKFVMQSLGKFHAISYAQYQGSFDCLKATYPYLEERFFRAPDVSPEVTQEWVRESLGREAQMLKDKSPDNEGPADALQNLVSGSFWEKMHKLTSCWTEVAIICHADPWTNNFLFKFDSNSEAKDQKAVDLKFVDFQLCRVGSRCLDLGYFMYSSPQIQILNEKEDELLETYFEAFKAFATKLGHFESKLTFDQLKEEYAAYRMYGIAMGCMLAPIMTAQSGDIPDLETMPEKEEEMMSEENKELWFGSIHKQKETYYKILNMAKCHIPKLRT